MGGILQLVCDKCDFLEDIEITSFIRNKQFIEAAKKWKEIEGMILCENCTKDWHKSFKKIRKENKVKFLKD